MKVVYVPRHEWGASIDTEAHIGVRPNIDRKLRTNVQVHNTAAIDVTDTTKNRWSYANAVKYMRKLQTSRPDLGPLPYNFNPAVSEDLETVWMFQGRGADKRGAHTSSYNVSGIGYGILGNFDNRDDPAADALILAIERHATELRDNGMVNLTTLKNPKGWDAWGHRDTSTKSCPGNYLYPKLVGFGLGKEEEDMPLSNEDIIKVRDAIFNHNMRHDQTFWLQQSRMYDLVSLIRGDTDSLEEDIDELVAAIKLLPADTVKAIGNKLIS